MRTQAVFAWVDTLVFAQTGEHLSDLQKTILQNVWQGHKYLEIADYYGCTEGHVKDVASELWKLLSKQLGEKITKSNCRTALARYLQANIQTNDFALVAAPSVKLEAANFVGRVAAIAHLNNLLSQEVKVVVIQGEGGLGKTTLAQQYLHQGFDLVLELLMAKETQNITSAE